MRSLQSAIAVVCVLLMLAPGAAAQFIQDPGGGGLSGLTGPYRTKVVAPISVSNSSRLDALLRAGNIYLSLQDAIALVLENNLDIQIQRYNRPLQQASLLRAQAGGPLRGVPSGVQTATTDTLSQITGGVIGTSGSAQASTSNSSGGTIITATGTAVPQLDPSLYMVGYWGHQTGLNANTITSGTSTLVNGIRMYQSGVQKAFLTGTNVSLGWQAQGTSTNSPLLSINPFITGSMNLTVTQPLLQGFLYSPNSRYIKIAKNNLKINDYVFKAQVINTVSAVVSAYWTLVSDIENVKVKEQALSLAQKLLNDNKKQVEIGTLAPISIVQAEAEVATREQELVTARTSVLQQETLLKNALSRTGVAGANIADAHIIPTNHITVPATEPVVPVQDLVQTALKKRPEVHTSSINIDSSRIGLSGSKSELLPQLGLYLNMTNNALAGTAQPVVDPFTGQLVQVPGAFIGGYGSTFSQLFSRKYPSYSAGIQLNLPLRNRSAQADYEIDALNVRTQELQHQRLLNQIRVDVQNALIAVQQASAGYAAAVKARDLARQTLDAEQKKYALGASTIFLVIQYQRDLASAGSVEVAAGAAYARAKVQLQGATGETLDAYNISMEEAEKGRVARKPDTPPDVQK
jgi:outer membrane protein